MRKKLTSSLATGTRIITLAALLSSPLACAHDYGRAQNNYPTSGQTTQTQDYPSNFEDRKNIETRQYPEKNSEEEKSENKYPWIGEVLKIAVQTGTLLFFLKK